MKFDPRNGRPENGREARLALKNKYQNTSHQRKRELLRRLDNSVMRSDVDPDVFLSEVFQLLDELNDHLGETVTDERLTTIILDEGKQNDTNCLMSRMNGKKTHTHFT